MTSEGNDTTLDHEIQVINRWIGDFARVEDVRCHLLQEHHLPLSLSHLSMGLSGRRLDGRSQVVAERLEVA